MKTLSKLFCVILLLTLLLGCKKKCDAFNEKYAMFIPKNMALNDSITFYSNYGDSVSFYFKGKQISEPTEYSSCDDCECTATLDVGFVSKDNKYHISYALMYYGNESSTIGVRINYHYLQYYTYTHFSYNPGSNPVTKIEDSILVNDVYYKDVVVISNTYNSSDNLYFDKVYVAKDMGVIMATVKNSDVVWAINKFE